MNLRQLEAFHQVILTGSISEAAREMCRSQPAITALIKGLEESVGFPLFERRGRRLVPLPEARHLHEETKEILSRVNRVHQTMESFRKAEKGTLRVAAALAPSLSLIPGLIKDLLLESDQINVAFETSSSVEVFHLLASHQTDIGFIDMGGSGVPFDETLIQYQPFKMNGLVAMASEDPLAGLDVVTPGDLSGRALVVLRETHLVFQNVARAFKDAGAIFNPRLQALASYTKFVPIRERAVVGIVDPLTARGYIEWCRDDAGIVFKPFEPTVRYEFAVATPAFLPQSIIVRTFKERLVQRIPDYAEYFSGGAKPV